MYLLRILLFVVATLAGLGVRATVRPATYGVMVMPDSARLQRGAAEMTDSALLAHPMMASKYIMSDIETPHIVETQTADFYLLLFLCLMLGLIRFMDTRYFLNLWRAFWNPTLSNRQLKEQLQGSGLPDLLMNVFFTFAGGAYIYYVVRFFTPRHSGVIPPSLLIIMLITGTALIYLAKYAAIRFSGWAFRVEGITDHYLFNVFLINKVLGITLVPFIIILAFADHEWAQQVVIISFVVSGILLLNRYLRSWQVFGLFSNLASFIFLCTFAPRNYCPWQF